MGDDSLDHEGGESSSKDRKKKRKDKAKQDVVEIKLNLGQQHVKQVLKHKHYKSLRIIFEPHCLIDSLDTSYFQSYRNKVLIDKLVLENLTLSIEDLNNILCLTAGSRVLSLEMKFVTLHEALDTRVLVAT